MGDEAELEITDITRRALFDELTLAGLPYSGTMSEDEFLARLYPLDKMPSADDRFPSFLYDIRQHRVAWPDDWPDSWVWTDARLDLKNCPDDDLLRFLEEMVHPAVRPNKPDEIQQFLAIFNRHLRVDGFEIVQDGHLANRPRYRARRVHGGIPPVLDNKTSLVDLGQHVRDQIERMRSALQNDHALAIGTAKELVETVSKTVLQRLGKPYDPKEDLPKLAKDAIKALPVVPPEWKEDPRAKEAVMGLLQALANIAHRLAELRNAAGSGHGRAANASSLGAAHARLAVDCAAGLAAFMVEALNAQPHRPAPTILELLTADPPKKVETSSALDLLLGVEPSKKA